MHYQTRTQLDVAIDAQETSSRACIRHIQHDSVTPAEISCTGRLLNVVCQSCLVQRECCDYRLRQAKGNRVEVCSCLTWSTATSNDASEVYARLIGVPPASVLPSLQPETRSYSATKPDTLCQDTCQHCWQWTAGLQPWLFSEWQLQLFRR